MKGFISWTMLSLFLQNSVGRGNSFLPTLPMKTSSVFYVFSLIVSFLSESTRDVFTVPGRKGEWIYESQECQDDDYTTSVSDFYFLCYLFYICLILNLYQQNCFLHFKCYFCISVIVLCCFVPVLFLTAIIRSHKF